MAVTIEVFLEEEVKDEIDPSILVSGEIIVWFKAISYDIGL